MFMSNSPLTIGLKNLQIMEHLLIRGVKREQEMGSLIFQAV
jgi:hypothetical protein